MLKSKLLSWDEQDLGLLPLQTGIVPFPSCNPRGADDDRSGWAGAVARTNFQIHQGRASFDPWDLHSIISRSQLLQRPGPSSSLHFKKALKAADNSTFELFWPLLLSASIRSVGMSFKLGDKVFYFVIYSPLVSLGLGIFRTDQSRFFFFSGSTLGLSFCPLPS